METTATILFVFTLMVSMINVFKLVSICFGNPISLPGMMRYEFTTPDKWYLFYPCFFYQLYFWSNYLNLI